MARLIVGAGRLTGDPVCGCTKRYPNPRLCEGDITCDIDPTTDPHILWDFSQAVDLDKIPLVTEIYFEAIPYTIFLPDEETFAQSVAVINCAEILDRVKGGTVNILTGQAPWDYIGAMFLRAGFTMPRWALQYIRGKDRLVYSCEYLGRMPAWDQPYHVSDI